MGNHVLMFIQKKGALHVMLKFCDLPGDVTSLPHVFISAFCLIFTNTIMSNISGAV